MTKPKQLRVLDLCAGLGGLSRGFKQRGHDTITLDYDPKFGCDLTMDVREFAKDPWKYIHQVRPDWDSIDVIVTGPPCEGLSVLTIGRNWTRHHQPKTDQARLAVELVRAVLEAIRVLAPKWWWMENPRAKLRKLPVAKGIRRVTVTYCQYGAAWQKPTDLWGKWPGSWKPRPTCRPKNPCHVSAPRGSRRGPCPEGCVCDALDTPSAAPSSGVPADVLPSPAIGANAVSVRRHPAGISWSIDAQTEANSGSGPRSHPGAIQNLSGTAAAVRAEAPEALSLSFAIACEDPTPPRSNLEAWA